MHKGLAKVARGKAAGSGLVAFNLFLNDPVFDKLVKALIDQTELPVQMSNGCCFQPARSKGSRARNINYVHYFRKTACLRSQAVIKRMPFARPANYWEIRLCAPAYVDGMLKREESMSTSLGNGVRFRMVSTKTAKTSSSTASRASIAGWCEVG